MKNKLLCFGLLILLSFGCEKDDQIDQKQEVPVIKVSLPKYGEPVKDIDNNIYQTVTIGTQVWMTENLRTTRYRNGDLILNVSNDIDWREQKTGAYCNYNNDDKNVLKHGRLYNGYAVRDSRNIAPEGWHVNTDEEWEILIKYIQANPGPAYSAGRAIGAKTDWIIANEINNSSGFNALPSGNRINGFENFGIDASWWTSSVMDTLPIIRMYYRGLKLEDGLTWFTKSFLGMESGLSVRCIKD